MKNIKQMRGYIPLGGPGVNELVPEDDTDPLAGVCFTTRWFHERIGINFSEEFHSNPLVRFESMLKMKRHVRESFPQIRYFQKHDQNGFEQECATISGAFGICFVAMVYGLKVVYGEGAWPAIDIKSKLSIDDIKKLKPFDLSVNSAVEQLFHQMDIIEQNYGVIDGYINYQGVLNNAFKIRGTDILYDFIEDPGLALHLFDHITDTMINLIQLVQKRQRDSGFFVDSFVTSNCVVNMISPETYTDFLLPYDDKLSKAFSTFGVHTCNWVIDPYIDVLNKLENLAYIDCGPDSDLEKVKRVYSSARRGTSYEPNLMHKKTDREILLDIRKIYDKLGPCDITLPDVDVYTSDDDIIRFVNITESVFNQENGNTFSYLKG